MRPTEIGNAFLQALSLRPSPGLPYAFNAVALSKYGVECLTWSCNLKRWTSSCDITSAVSSLVLAVLFGLGFDMEPNYPSQVEPGFVIISHAI